MVMLQPAAAQRLRYTYSIDAGLLAGNKVTPTFTAQVFNGLYFEKLKVRTGITTGIDAYRQFTILPVAAGIKLGPFNQEAVSPYFSLDAGYGLSWLQRRSDSRQVSGGYTINPAVGLQFKTKSALKCQVSAGYRRQKAELKYTRNPIEYDSSAFEQYMATDEFTFSRISLTFGMSF